MKERCMVEYIPYHLHTEYSLLDSCTKVNDYIELAKQNNIKALSFSEHGKNLNWTEKWNACKEAGIRYIHSVEIYLTEDLENKVRDNYHTVLMARNMDGVRELNDLISLSCDEHHFYYTNRISFDEFLNISDNIISTSACLASPLNKLDETNPFYEPLVQKYTFLEVQAHDNDEQREFNKRLLRLAKKYNKPIIAGTDTHSANQYKAECRKIRLKSRHKNYGNEDEFDLTFKTADELLDMFKVQGVLSYDMAVEAIKNTNLLLDMTEELDLDVSFKYPILYGSRENDEKKLKEILRTNFKDKIERGIIKQESVEAYKNSIKEEMEVFHKLNMEGFILSMSEITTWCKSNGINLGAGRGSVGGSRVAFILNITEIDAEKYQTVFSRFCNAERVELGDIDTDCIEEDRPRIFKYVTERFGDDKTARVASFGTVQDKAVIDEIGRALFIDFEEKFGKDNPQNPYTLKKISKIKADYEASPEDTRLANKELFYYFDGLVGTKISQSIHPAGIVISPITLKDNYGVFDKNGENCLVLDMDNIHDFTGLVKYDFLILKTIQVIKDTCKYLKKSYPRIWEIDLEDKDVYENMSKDLTTVFQFESKFAADCYKKFKPKSIEELALVTASIRPSGASYRDALLKRQIHYNPSALIDDLLKRNFGYLCYQEDTIKFLTDICGFDGSTADTVRRGIGRKKKEILDAAMPKILEGYCSKSEKPKEEAEEEAKEFLRIIEDSADYQFNYSHAIAYSLVSYLCGYYRYHYPLEYLTSYLNNAANDEDIRNGTEYAKRIGIKVTMPKWGFSKGEYAYDKEKNVIAKGLSSIKYMSEKVASELYEQAHLKKYDRFIDVLKVLNENTTIDTRQIDILIKIDFFSEFGNQRELLYITDVFFNLFKKGVAKKIRKETAKESPFEDIIIKYSVGVTKAGTPSASYTLLDIDTIMQGVEDRILSQGMEDLSDLDKVKNFTEVMGYSGYISGKDEDRKKLIITELKPLTRKKDGKQFGYSFYTRSVGSGIESRFTVFNRVYEKEPVKKGDLIICNSWSRDGQYFRLDGYKLVECLC